jgi:hypothetical protein
MIMRPTAASLLVLSFLCACAEGPGDPDRDPPGQTVGDGSSSDSSAGMDDGPTTQTDPMDGDAESSGPSGGDTSGGIDDMPCDGQCVANAPNGWHGPAALVRSAGADEAPECAGSHPLALATFVSDLVVQSAICDCNCGEAVGVTCDAATARVYSNDDCTGLLDSFDVGLSCENDLDPVEGWWQLAFAAPSGGSCDALPTSEVPAVEYTRWTLCGGEALAGDCDIGESCATPPSAAFEASQCVWREGDVACPTGAYTERTLVHGEISDDRACGECSCAAPTGICSGGEAKLSTSANCPELDVWFTLLLEGDECQDFEFYYESGIITEPATPYASCEPTMPASLGEASLEQPFTVCCEPQ